jgi:hypothetical protein
MHGMKKKRVPRPVRNPIVEAIRGCQPIGGKDLTDLRLVELSAIDDLARGTATRRSWEGLADLLNVAEAMAKSGIGTEVIAIAAEAQVTLARVAVRAKAEGSWYLTTDEAWTLRTAWEYADLQRLCVTLNDYRRYLKQVADIRRTGANAITAEQLLEQLNDNT